MNELGFDTQEVHRYYSAHCFNSVWDLLGKESRTPDDDQQMLQLAMASTWHWTQREDCSDKNLSVGYWQVSRVYTVIQQHENARQYAQMCLAKTPNDESFYLGYAHEAIARAEKLAGNVDAAAEHLEIAVNYAAKVDDENSREMLDKDLAELK
ncbi:MAG: tetratricopeptide (TPR) repeat protein [Pirellulaceae bacterium]|jgi:tetratricopeptide (TPR) repeat protein